MKLFGLVLLLMGITGFASAGEITVVPEISPVSAVGGLALLSGALLVIRGRRKG